MNKFFRETKADMGRKFSKWPNWGSVLVFNTQDRGFKPGRSRRIFKGK